MRKSSSFVITVSKRLNSHSSDTSDSSFGSSDSGEEEIGICLSSLDSAYESKTARRLFASSDRISDQEANNENRDNNTQLYTEQQYHQQTSGFQGTTSNNDDKNGAKDNKPFLFEVKMFSSNQLQHTKHQEQHKTEKDKFIQAITTRGGNTRDSTDSKHRNETKVPISLFETPRKTSQELDRNHNNDLSQRELLYGTKGKWRERIYNAYSTDSYDDSSDDMSGAIGITYIYITSPLDSDFCDDISILTQSEFEG